MPHQPSTKKTNRARKAPARGHRAEFWAALYLRFKAYRILARNLRLPGGEIDLVAKRGNLLVFVEVKYRPDRAAARAAVSARQWRRIERAAGQFVARHKALQQCRWRFDVLAMGPWRWPYHGRNMWRGGAAQWRG
jgi:putative endonuclease